VIDEGVDSYRRARAPKSLHRLRGNKLFVKKPETPVGKTLFKSKAARSYDVNATSEKEEESRRARCQASRKTANSRDLGEKSTRKNRRLNVSDKLIKLGPESATRYQEEKANRRMYQRLRKKIGRLMATKTKLSATEPAEKGNHGTKNSEARSSFVGEGREGISQL